MVHVLRTVSCGLVPQLAHAYILQCKLFPYGGACGNGLVESDKAYLARNMRTNTLAVVAADDAGEVLGQYIGEIEDISASRSQRPCNSDYRLVLSQRPERLTWPIRAATNVERVGGLMRSVKHACGPVAKFVEVGNVRRLAVVVASTRQEVTVDYSDDLWFICRCRSPRWRHRDLQDEKDP
ncbi:hypothetical protein F444_18815 [Phytophthora nicotianae P1976]|uniref:SET domain-containing protein n=1 Tax=Phytophthora nicotianae P1976 TaxID=1317066 RepID=A0A080ZA25_PHYNI|nr:hypothetical protein F444_18815 [Phytophthora nicotianae P1976]